jgi:hypothetical protein
MHLLNSRAPRSRAKRHAPLQMPVRPLLRLIRVKCSLLDLRPLYQFPDPFEQSLIGESGREAVKMLDLLVEFDAPVTHSIPPLFGRPSHLSTTERQFCFNGPGSFGSGYCVSCFDEAISGQGRPSDRHRHRQAVADLTHLRRNHSPEIATTARCCIHRPVSALERIADSRFPNQMLAPD